MHIGLYIAYIIIIIINRSLSATLHAVPMSVRQVVLFCAVRSPDAIKLAQIFLHRP